jgi:hypothetical protein
MASYRMLRRVALARTDVSEELGASFIMVTRIGELGTMLVTASVVPSSPSLVTLMKEALSISETSVLTRATRRNIPEDAILQFTSRKSCYKSRVFTQLITSSVTYGLLQILLLAQTVITS